MVEHKDHLDAAASVVFLILNTIYLTILKDNLEQLAAFVFMVTLIE